MASVSGFRWAAALFSSAVALCAVSACSDDTTADMAAGGSGAGRSAALGGSNSGKSGSPASEEQAGMVGSQGGSDQASAGEPSSPIAGKGGSSLGASGAAAGGATVGEPPGPAPDGGSVYAVRCSGDTAMCGVEGTHCLGIALDTNGVGYSCSNHCSTVADCSDAPSGAEATPGCVQFQKEKRCMLVCYNQPNTYACPDGMSCYIYPNAPIGYCLWTN